MMRKSVVGFLIVCLVSCAGYKEIAPTSPEFHELKKGDVIWVHTGMVARKRVVFNNVVGDSLFADEYAFHIDSITRIQKEYRSSGNTGFLVGVLTVIEVVAVVSLLTGLAVLLQIF